MSKITNAFANNKIFIPFITAGDPNLDKTYEFILEMEKGGAPLVEIGIPFSDPIAEGPVVQCANVRALKGGCTTDKVFDMIAKVRKVSNIPLVFIAYLNQLFKYGYERFLDRCKAVGIDGILIPDMPIEEKGELDELAKAYNIDIISIIASAPVERIEMIAKQAEGYIYVIPAPEGEGMDGAAIAKAIKNVTDTPVAVRFDSEDDSMIDKVYEYTDAIMVDNALVHLIEAHGENAGEHIYEYVKKMVGRANR